ncbi:hypothetical protein DJ030_15980 [bacterium endosymbiont of Escarpia laminata]|nr:MAG: hypothetical protein DJ030_15980 [bacterium endosymbiont of Escarpia laminata]
MDDVGKSRNELIEEVSRLHRVRHHVRQTGFEVLHTEKGTDLFLFLTNKNKSVPFSPFRFPFRFEIYSGTNRL